MSTKGGAAHGQGTDRHTGTTWPAGNRESLLYEAGRHVATLACPLVRDWRGMPVNAGCCAHLALGVKGRVRVHTPALDAVLQHRRGHVRGADEVQVGLARPVQACVSGGRFDFVCSSARMMHPHGAYSYVQTGYRNQENAHARFCGFVFPGSCMYTRAARGVDGEVHVDGRPHQHERHKASEDGRVDLRATQGA